MPRTSPLAEIEARLQLCRTLQYEQPHEARTYAEEALAIAKKHRLVERATHCQRMIGICYYAESDYTTALGIFESTLPSYRRRKDRVGESRALQNMALTLRQMGRNDDALGALSASERIVRALHDDAYLMTILTSVGSLHAVVGRRKEALQAFSECLTIAERLDDALMRARIMGNIADIYVGIGDTDMAIEWSEKSLELHRNNNDSMGVGLTLSNLGRVYQSIGDLDAALASLNKALEVMLTLHDEHAQGRVLRVLAAILVQKRRYRKAEAMAQRALDIFIRTNDVEGEVRALIILLEAAVQRKDYVTAKQQLDRARNRLRHTDNVSLSIKIDQHVAALLIAQHDLKQAYTCLAQAARKASKHKMYDLESHLNSRLAELCEQMDDYPRALSHERRASKAQQEADAQVRSQHSQGLILRLDMEREARDRERVELMNQRLSLELESRERELNVSALSIAQKNELLSDLERELQQVMRNASTTTISGIRSVLRKIDLHRRTGEDWRTFQEQLADVHESFITELTSRHPELTAKETQLASLLKLNLSSKEISQVLNTGVPTIEVYRSNLRKKLRLSSGMSLITYIQSLG